MGGIHTKFIVIEEIGIHLLSLKNQIIDLLPTRSVIPKLHEAIQKTYGENADLHTETTYCWCLVDDDFEYENRQFFINVTAGIAMIFLPMHSATSSLCWVQHSLELSLSTVLLVHFGLGMME